MLMRDPLVVALTVAGVALVGLMLLLLPFVLAERWRQDRESILEEAARRDCKVRSIRVCWLRVRGPFAWEWHPKRCRFYWVDCRDEHGDRRRACVLIGPRRPWDSEDVLTWRWDSPERPE
jgi:hypothetical protein